jgi:hypothetical protein
MYFSYFLLIELRNLTTVKRIHYDVKLKSVFKTLTLLKLSRTKNVNTSHGHIHVLR